MPIRVGINGFGRIGRLAFRAMAEQPGQFEIAAINDLSDINTLAHLLKYDSVHGRFSGSIQVDGSNLIVNGSSIKMLQVRDPAKLPWGDQGVSVALESTGVFTQRESERGGYGDHLKAGARRVIISAPAKDDPDLTVVVGVNDGLITDDDLCISNASCTTNCLAPMAKVLHENFNRIKSGLMTTVHAYTNDQVVNDFGHSDLHRARAAGCNIIPTSTGAAKAVGLVIPELGGLLTGMAMRVPVPDGSVTDLTALLGKKVTKAEINDAMKAASEGELKGVLEYTEDPIVSSDIVHNPHSCIFSAEWTMVMGGNMAKVVGWYDNEWGYSNRTADLIKKVG